MRRCLHLAPVDVQKPHTRNKRLGGGYGARRDMSRRRPPLLCRARLNLIQMFLFRPLRKRKYVGGEQPSNPSGSSGSVLALSLPEVSVHAADQRQRKEGAPLQKNAKLVKNRRSSRCKIALNQQRDFDGPAFPPNSSGLVSHPEVLSPVESAKFFVGT
jgi:hypothetical protein